MPSMHIQPVVQGEGLSQQASLLVSILIMYPELVSARFGPIDGQLIFSIMLSGSYGDAELSGFRRRMRAHLAAYMALTRREGYFFRLSGLRHGQHTLVEITRDVASLSQQELSLLLALIRSHFGAQLMYEASEPLHEEESMLQEELIDETLEDVREMASRRELVGYREAGRVLVFNRRPAEPAK